MAGITSTKKIKGQPHLLAYITPNEVKKLKALGGQETMTEEGIPAYPEFDNYGYSSQADFDAGDRSKSNDPNVRQDSTFETYRGNKNIGVDLALQAKLSRDKKAREEAKKALAKGQTYGYGPNQTYFQKMGTKTRNHNIKKRNAYIKRILQQRQDEMTSGLLQSNVPGIDVMDMKDYFSFAPSVKKYGPDGTGKYSQEFINDVLSGKRAPPEFFSKINVASAGGGMYGKGAAALANILGPGMAGPVTSERLNQLYNEYQNIQKIDPTSMDAMSTKQMMEIYEPNRYKLMYGDGQPSDDNNQPYLPINYNTGAGITEDVVDDKEFAYHLGLGGQKVGADVTRASYVFNQGGRVPRNMGGIMNSVPRQGYFLGGIGKAIKGVVGGVADAAKKVLGSDLGKAALAGAAFMYGPKLFGATKLGGFGGYNQLVPRIAGSDFLSKMLLNKDSTGFNPFKVAGILGVGGAALFGREAPPNEDSFSDRGGSLTDPLTGNPAKPAEMRSSLNTALANANGDPARIKQIQDAYAFLIPDERLGTYLPYRTYGVKDGGRIGKAEGGLMDLGGMEKDYRAEGGFVPIGREEKADDVPARLSVNEFVFTADAVRNAGGGDIDKGAEVMENMMKNLENGGTVSEESQGNTGAQQMFSVSERIGEVI